MKTHITKNHAKKDKNGIKKPLEKEDLNEEEIIKKMHEQYGTGTITNLPSIEEILNYDKDKKVTEVKEIPDNSGGAVMDVDESLEDENKLLKTANKDMKDRIKSLKTN